MGERVVAGQRYAVTPNGLPDVNPHHLMFIAPAHQWRIEWAPEVATVVFPEGFTLHRVSPSMVAGSVEAHRQSLPAQLKTAPAL